MKKSIIALLIIFTLCSTLQAQTIDTKKAQTLQSKINKIGPTIKDHNDLLNALDANKITLKDIYNSGNNRLCILANKISLNYDSDKDTLPDFYEIFKYETDPNNPDSDGDGIPDSDWNERLEYTDTISYTTKIMNVYNLDAMNNAFQDYRIVEQADTYTIFEIVHYPNNRCYDRLYQNQNWSEGYPEEMQQYLQPYLLANWDEQMKNDLINELRKGGIYPEKLSDLELVRAVTRWVERRNTRITCQGLDNFIEIDENNNIAEQPQRKHYADILKRNLPNLTYQEMLNKTVLGKEMFYNKSISHCLSSSTHHATVLRALGIPTRIVSMTHMFNTGDTKQTNLINNLDPELKTQFINKMPGSGWNNHYHLQCYIGNLWVDIDYDKVPCNFSTHLLGFITFSQCNDLSEFIPIANDKWFDHLFAGKPVKGFDSYHPYQLIDLKNTKAKY